LDEFISCSLNDIKEEHPIIANKRIIETR